MSAQSTFYKRKMGAEELQAHLELARRARTFKDKRKDQSKRMCRSNKGKHIAA